LTLTVYPTSLQISERAALDERLQQMQAQIATLTLALASAGLTSPYPTVVDGPGPTAAAQRGPGIVDAAVTATANVTVTEIATAATTTSAAAASPATLSEATMSHKQPPTVATSPPGTLELLRLGNDRTLCFEKESVPDPPGISFTKDIPHLVKMWDDSSVDWDPTQAVLHIQGEPIALKHWKFLYRYGKAGQWAGTKKIWSQWQVSFRPRLPSAMCAYLTLPEHRYELARAHRGRLLANVFLL
jgi:hypothetical protein